MFSLNLNYRFVFESIYVKSKHTYTESEFYDCSYDAVCD